MRSALLREICGEEKQAHCPETAELRRRAWSRRPGSSVPPPLEPVHVAAAWLILFWIDCPKNRCFGCFRRRLALPLERVCPVALTPPLPAVGQAPPLACMNARSFLQISGPNWKQAASMPAVTGVPFMLPLLESV